mgnify:CR=1 FL=1
MVRVLMSSYVMFVIENPHMIYCSSLAFSYFFQVRKLIEPSAVCSEVGSKSRAEVFHSRSYRSSRLQTEESEE